jgi:transcriptional regulator with XRE-family HTH domain
MPPPRQSTPRSPEHAALGEAVRLARVERGMSQEQLADATPIHITYLGGVERGTRKPSYETVVRLARALALEPGELVTRADRVRASDPR